MTQLKDIVYVMEAEDKLSFVSTGTNKNVVEDSTGTQSIIFQATGGIGNNEIGLSANGSAAYEEGYVYVNSSGAAIGFDDDSPNTLMEFASNSWTTTVAGSIVLEGNATGLGFFGSTPVAKPTITGSRGGNAALADLLTDLASLGLITDSTTA